MIRSSRKTKHIFCLEGNWENDLRAKLSVNSALNFLSEVTEIKHIYRNCGTREELEYYLNQYMQKRYYNYSICYLAFHGKPGLLKIGSDKFYLDELADILGNSCKDKIIHFGACQTLSIDNRVIRNFIRETNALCVCGYTTDVKFLSSSAFDLLLFEMFQKYNDITCVYRDMKYYYGHLIKELGFKFIYI